MQPVPAEYDVEQGEVDILQLIAEVEAGREVVLRRSGKPVARMDRVASRAKRTNRGVLQGKFTIPDDFDELPEDIARSLGMV